MSRRLRSQDQKRSQDPKKKSKKATAELAKEDSLFVEETNLDNESVEDSQEAEPTIRKFEARYFFTKLQELILVSNVTDLISEMNTCVQKQRAVFEVQETQIKVLQTQIECTKQKATYANMVRAPQKLTDVVLGKPQTVLVEGVDKEMSPTTVGEALRKSLRPTDLKVGIVKMRLTKNGVAIMTKDEEDMKLIETAISENNALKDQVIAKRPKKANPKVILYNINFETSETELQEALVTQNEIANAKVVFTIKRKAGTHWVLETTPEDFRKLSKHKRIYIGWQRIFLKEFISPMQCYKCGRYGHTSKTCGHEASCYNCGKVGHPAASCKSKTKCINCHEGNRNLGYNYDTNHSCWDHICPTRSYYMKRTKLNINYGDN